jgi:hypothetical protein
MAATLKVIASAPRDEFGRFIADVSRESVLIGDLSIEPNRWEQLQHAGIVARHGGAASQRYSFCDRPLLQHALLLSVLENLGRNQAEAETPGRITPANGTDVAAAPRFPQENGIPPFPNSVKGWSSSNDRRPISKVLR